MMREKLQGAVNMLNSGLLLLLLRGAVLAMVAVLLGALFMRSQFTALTDPSSMELADTARHLANGEGYRTACMQSVDVALLGDGAEAPSSVPQLAFPPLWPAALSVAMRVVPVQGVAFSGRVFACDIYNIFPVGMCFLLLAALAAYLFAIRYGGAEVATPAAIVVLLAYPSLSAVCAGTGMPAVMFFATCALWSVWEAAVARRVWSQLVLSVVVGLCAGLSLLVAWSAWAVAVAVLIFAMVEMRRLRWVAVLLLCVAMAAVVVPVLLHNTALCGSPTGTSGPRLAAELGLLQSDVNVTASPEVVPSLDIVVRAVRAALRRTLSRDAGVWPLADGIFGFLVLLLLFRNHERQGGGSLRFALLGGLLSTWVVSRLIGQPCWVFFLPVVSVVGLFAFFDYLREQQFFTAGAERYLLMVLVVAVAFPTLLKALVPASRSAYPPIHPRLQSFVCDAAGRDQGILATDIPWATAWYGEAPSVRLPLQWRDFSALQSNIVVQAVYLSERPEEPLRGRRSMWSDVWDGRLTETDTPFTNAYWLPGGTRQQLLLLATPASPSSTQTNAVTGAAADEL